MIIKRNINMEPYKFNIIFESSSIHGHSLMTDNKEILTEMIDNIIVRLNEMVAKHKEEKQA